MLRSIQYKVFRLALAAMVVVILINRPTPPPLFADCLPATGGTSCTG